MTKADIVNEISRSTNIEKAMVRVMVQSMIDVIKLSLCYGEDVNLRGFGSFIIRQRAQKTARDISRDTPIIVPARNVPYFRPSESFKQAVAHD